MNSLEGNDAMLVLLNIKLPQMKQLRMFLGCIYSTGSCSEDDCGIALSFILKTFLETGHLKCFRSKSEKAHIYRERSMFATEKRKTSS